MAKNLKNSPKVLGLDVSTRTIGWALFDIKTQELLELTHISPRPKMDKGEDDKLKELLLLVEEKGSPRQNSYSSFCSD